MDNAPSASASGRRRCVDPHSADRQFPWANLLGFALAGLGLSPCEAWAATPRELSLAAVWLNGGHRDAPAPADLAELMRRYPD